MEPRHLPPPPPPPRAEEVRMQLWHIQETWPDRQSVHTNEIETSSEEDESSSSSGDEKRQRVGDFQMLQMKTPPMPRGTETAEDFLFRAAACRTMPSPLPDIEVCAEMANAVLAEIAEGGGPSLERNLDILNRLNEVGHEPGFPLASQLHAHLSHLHVQAYQLMRLHGAQSIFAQGETEAAHHYGQSYKFSLTIDAGFEDELPPNSLRSP